MGLRQLLKRAVKPAAMAFVAAGVALSLVVSTPSNAQAFVLPIPVPAVFGATTMAIPELMATSAVLGPVAWGIVGVTAVGVGLYATKDYWLPYVTGAWGQFKQAIENITGSGTMGVNQNLRLSASTIGKNSPTSATATLTYENQPSGGFFTYTVALRYECDWDNYADANTTFNTYAVSSNQTFPFAPRDINVDCKATSGGKNLVGHVVGAEWGLIGTGQFQAYNPNNHKGSGPANYVSVGGFGRGGFDPHSADVKYETTVECIRPDGSKFMATAQSVGTDAAIKLAACEEREPGSHGTGKTTVTGLAPGDTIPEVLWDVQAPPVNPDKSLCAPTRPGPGCKLQILIDSAPCVVGTWNCANWLDLSKDPNWTPRISCQYGPYSVPLNTCNPLERAYEPDGAPATEENVDGDPSTQKNTDPAGNPQTGNPNGYVPSLMPGGPSTGAPPSSTTEQAECFPSGWNALNPIEWVMKPVGCALDAAFKPKKDLQARVSSMQNQFSNRVPMSWFGVGTSGVSGGSCPTNWALDVSGQHVSLICGTPAEGIIQAFRPVMGAMLVIAALWPLLRSLFYAAIPVFRVTPS